MGFFNKAKDFINKEILNQPETNQNQEKGSDISELATSTLFQSIRKYYSWKSDVINRISKIEKEFSFFNYEIAVNECNEINENIGNFNELILKESKIINEKRADIKDINHQIKIHDLEIYNLEKNLNNPQVSSISQNENKERIKQKKELIFSLKKTINLKEDSIKSHSIKEAEYEKLRANEAFKFIVLATTELNEDIFENIKLAKEYSEIYSSGEEYLQYALPAIEVYIDYIQDDCNNDDLMIKAGELANEFFNNNPLMNYTLCIIYADYLEKQEGTNINKYITTLEFIVDSKPETIEIHMALRDAYKEVGNENGFLIESQICKLLGE